MPKTNRKRQRNHGHEDGPQQSSKRPQTYNLVGKSSGEDDEQAQVIAGQHDMRQQQGHRNGKDHVEDSRSKKIGRKRAREEEEVREDDGSSDDDDGVSKDGSKETKEVSLTSLNDLDSKIAALEAELANGSDDDSSDDEEDDEEGKEDLSKSKVVAELIGKKGDDDDDDDDDEELEPIPPLPQHLLPAPGISKKILGGQDDKKEDNEEESFEMTCDACQDAPRFFSKESWERHRRTMLHRTNVLLKAGAAYEPARKRASYCRFCQVQFETADEFLAHRETEEHKESVRKERRLSYCQMCQKQFTSTAQLREHMVGKAHLERLDEKKREWSHKTARPQNDGGNANYNRSNQYNRNRDHNNKNYGEPRFRPRQQKH